jgi:hypothetical protein
MFAKFQHQWQALRTSRPGHRFRDRYERNQSSKDGLKLFWRVVRIAVAAGLVVVGLGFMFIPGPATLFFVIAAALLATDSLPLAKLLDWTEVKTRRLGARARRRWRRLSPFSRASVAALGIAVSLASSVLFYRIMAR